MTSAVLRGFGREVGKIGSGPERLVQEGDDYVSLYMDEGLKKTRWETLLWYNKLGTGPGAKEVPAGLRGLSILARPEVGAGKLGQVVAAMMLRTERDSGIREFMLARYMVVSEGGRVGPAHVFDQLEHKPLRVRRADELDELTPAFFSYDLSVQAPPVPEGWLREAMAWVCSGVPVGILTADAPTFVALAHGLWAALPELDRCMIGWSWQCAEDVDRLHQIVGHAERRSWAATWDPERGVWLPPTAGLDASMEVVDAHLSRPHPQARQFAAFVMGQPAGWKGLELVHGGPRDVSGLPPGSLTDGSARLRTLTFEFTEARVAEAFARWVETPDAAPAPFPSRSLNARVDSLARLVQQMARGHHPALDLALWQILEGPFNSRAAWEIDRMPDAPPRAHLLIALASGEGLVAALNRHHQARAPLVALPSALLEEEFDACLVAALKRPQEVVALAQIVALGSLGEVTPLVAKRGQAIVVALSKNLSATTGGQVWQRVVTTLVPAGAFQRALLAVDEGTSAAAWVPDLSPQQWRVVWRRLVYLWPAERPKEPAGVAWLEAAGHTVEAMVQRLPAGSREEQDTPLAMKVARGTASDDEMRGLEQHLMYGVVPHSLARLHALMLLRMIHHVKRLERTDDKQGDHALIDPVLYDYVRLWPRRWKERLAIDDATVVDEATYAHAKPRLTRNQELGILTWWVTSNRPLTTGVAVWLWDVAKSLTWVSRRELALEHYPAHVLVCLAHGRKLDATMADDVRRANQIADAAAVHETADAERLVRSYVLSTEPVQQWMRTAHPSLAAVMQASAQRSPTASSSPGHQAVVRPGLSGGQMSYADTRVPQAHYRQADSRWQEVFLPAIALFMVSMLFVLLAVSAGWDPWESMKGLWSGLTGMASWVLERVAAWLGGR